MDQKHDPEKHDIAPAQTQGSEYTIDKGDQQSEKEVFQINEDGVDFRTVTWPRAAIIFLKILFATGVLSIPAAMYEIGAAGGVLVLVACGALNCYMGKIQGDFRNKHPSCHSVSDMIGFVGGPVVKEMFGVLYIVAWVLCTGAGINGTSVAFNALSEHGACTVWFSFVAFIITALSSSVRTFANLGWLGWAGFISIYVAVFILVVAVTQVDRPAAAPVDGILDKGFTTWGLGATFSGGMVALTTIFVSTAGHSAFIPVIAEMRRPKDFNKSLYLCMGFVTASYVVFASVIYAYCGRWITAPALGSAGPVIKKVCYGIGLVGLIISGAFYNHVGAKYLFVRILRNTKHLQSNSMVHWATWLTCTFGLAAIAFLLAQAIPIFNYLIAITGSLCFGPLALMVPAWIWMFDHPEHRKGSIINKAWYGFHGLIFLLGAFICVGGTYGTIQAIINAYNDGTIGKSTLFIKSINADQCYRLCFLLRGQLGYSSGQRWWSLMYFRYVQLIVSHELAPSPYLFLLVRSCCHSSTSTRDLLRKQ